MSMIPVVCQDSTNIRIDPNYRQRADYSVREMRMVDAKFAAHEAFNRAVGRGDELIDKVNAQVEKLMER